MLLLFLTMESIRVKQVSVYGVYDYYLSRKSEPVSNNIAGVDISNKITSDEDKNKK